MSSASECPDCGAVLSGRGLASGLCPGCLLKLGLARAGLQYRTLTVLGAGPSGTVYLAARESAERKLVTVRHLAAGLAGKVEPVRFESVLERLIDLVHANIVPVLDGGIVEGGPVYVVSEFVVGASLATYCERHQPDLGQRLALLASISRAVEHAHRHGITHGHLAAPDVLVSLRRGPPEALVRDFGIRMLAGVNPDPTGDVAALGALLRELVSPYEPLSDALAGLVRKASAADGSRPTAREFASDLERSTSHARTASQ